MLNKSEINELKKTLKVRSFKGLIEYLLDLYFNLLIHQYVMQS